MATLIATANGNYTTAASWGVVDATSLLDSEVSNTALTTVYAESQAFTPGAITVDGLAVKVGTRNATPGAATISVRLAQAGALVAGTEVTLNISDLSARDGEQGWYFFKFAAPVLLVAATAYTLSAKTSVTTLVNLYRNATGANWSRMLRTTTTAAPAAGDNWFVLGEWTAAGTKTDRTITIDSTAATDYGGASLTVPSFAVGKGGIINFGTTAATTYILRLSGILAVYHGGVMNLGTVATPVPRGSSSRIEFDNAADGQFGLRVFGTCIMQGLSRTVGKNIVQCLLNTDEAVAQTVLGIDTDTGWLNGDDVALASTTQTATQAETRTLSADAVAASITVSAGLTNAHSGTSPTQAEVILLTRNVRIESVSATFQAFVLFGPAAQVDVDWAAFRYCGGDGTTGKRGVEIGTSVAAAGSCTMSYCSLRDSDTNGIFVSAADHGSWSIDNTVGYNLAAASSTTGVYVDASTQSTWSITDVTLIMLGASNSQGFRFNGYLGVVTRIKANSSADTGVWLNMPTGAGLMQNVWNGMDCHSCANAGLNIAGLHYGKLTNVNIWRCNSAAANAGLVLSNNVNVLIEGGNFFGSQTRNVMINTSGLVELTLRNVTSGGDTTFATTSGIETAVTATRITLENCDFSTVAGIKTAHTNDINFTATATEKFMQVRLRNTKLGAANEITNLSMLKGKSFISYQRVDQVTGTAKTFFVNGLITYDTTVFRTAAPSEKLEPSANSGTGWRFESSLKRAGLAITTTVTVTVYVRKSATYVGSAPRLILKANPSLGVDTDSVLDTHTAAADTWEALTGTTPAAEESGLFEFCVDCEGAVGAVYVDDWSVS